MLIRMIAGTLFILATGAALERANADQTFVCADGKSITVSSSGLADAKRFDPCVAGHYQRRGLVFRRDVPIPKRRPQRVSAVANQAVELAVSRVPPPVTLPTGTLPTGTLPTGTLVVTGGSTTTSPSLTPQFKGAAEPDVASQMDRRLAELGAGTFRRVLVINHEGASKWFNHTR